MLQYRVTQEGREERQLEAATITQVPHKVWPEAKKVRCTDKGRLTREYTNEETHERIVVMKL
jgi:hypothetical protein